MAYQGYNYPAYNGYMSGQAYPPRTEPPVYQQPMQQQVPPMQMANAAQPGFVCRPVTSREEALAVQVDFLGPGTVMPDLGHGTIYLKRFNPSTGASDLYAFVAQQPQAEPPKQDQGNAFVGIQDFINLQDTVRQLSDEIDRLKKPAGRVKKNDTDE